MKRRLIDHRWVLPAAIWLAAFVIALPLDRPVYHLLFTPGSEHADWAMIFRELGYLPTWLIVAALVWIADAYDPPRRRGVAASCERRPAFHRAGLVVLSPLLGGIAANVLKPLLGRLRPDAEGFVHFAPRPDLLWGNGGDIGLGLPSGHTTTAFAACGMLALLAPAWRIPMMLLASGCAATRLLAGAHSLSDVVAGAGLGLAVAWALYAAGEGPRRGPAGGLIPRA
ncbi:MAG: phosphatase PAP2 family protein [Phycisphaeraceae bacterium]|nr:MAG: phosphatase PAP2 family protein [Phycisphaeraceae bacterium]